MKRSVIVAIVCGACSTVRAQSVVFEQPHNGTGTIYRSAWWDPDGSNWDQYIWDAFSVQNAAAITQVRWRGGFDPAYNGSGGPVLGFTIELWSSIQGGSQPDIGSVFAPNPLRHYVISGNCNQTPAGVFGGVALYDYQYTLPAAFQAAAGTRYWLRIHAWQHGVPDWGFAAASGGDNYYFRKLAEYMYQTAPGDMAFAFLTSGGTSYNIAATAQPANAGTITGTGAYPAGSVASLTAVPSAGFGFVNWTESGTPVSSNATYSFTVTGSRTLVAIFTTAFLITTSASPAYAGWTSGDGQYNSGANVTVTASANAGYQFTEWTEYGAQVSTAAAYTFPAAGNRSLVANFVPAGTMILFDFDNAPIHTSLPLDVTAGGHTAHLSATGQGFSIQQANTMGFTPAGFSGYCIYPNSVFAADLEFSFTDVLTAFSIMYSPQELGCDTSATMRATAYRGAAFVATNTTIAPQPGTWPTGTLTVATPAGFDRVVVHYEARPATCQDWGPIFLADNMLIQLACERPSLAQQPASDATCSIGGSSFFAGMSGTLPLQPQWQAELSPGQWSDLVDGDLVEQGVVVCTLFGTASDWLQVFNLGSFRSYRATLNIRCAVNNACGTIVSDVATLTVWPTGTADVNQDGIVDADDIPPFVENVLGGWQSQSSWCASDLDLDGWVDQTEVPLMVSRLLAS